MVSSSQFPSALMKQTREAEGMRHFAAGSFECFAAGKAGKMQSTGSQCVWEGGSWEPRLPAVRSQH